MEEIVKTYQTVVGRTRKETEKLGTYAAGYIGKHIVGTGEDTHLTTKVYFDFSKVHVVLVCGKRGTVKSYSAGVLIEEFSFLPEEYKNKTSFVIFDPVGIYWSMKFPNDTQKALLETWNLEPKSLNNIKVLVPKGQEEAYKKIGIPIDGTISLSLRDISIEEILLAFGLKRTDEIAIALEKHFSMFLEKEGDFDLKDLISSIEKDNEIKTETKNALINLLRVADSWGLVSKKGSKINELIKPGQILVIDVSRMRSDELRSLLVSLISKEIYRNRVISRKEEEKARMENRKPSFIFPITWLVLEEAHNWIPSDKDVPSSEAIKTIAKQGREPGVGLITITQMPNKIHQDILSQTDIVISFRLTSENDIKALYSVMHTYVRKKLEVFFDELPRVPGSAIILDDNLEKIFTVQIRPRVSHHAGGTATLL